MTLAAQSVSASFTDAGGVAIPALKDISASFAPG